MVSRLRYGRPIFAALVVLILAGLYFAAGAGHQAAAAAHAGRPVRATVSTAQRVCAAPGSVAPTKGGVAVTAVPGSSGSGSAAITPLDTRRQFLAGCGGGDADEARRAGR